MPWNKDRTKYTPAEGFDADIDPKATKGPTGWNKDRTKYTPIEGFDADIEAKANKRPTRPTMFEQPAAPTYKPPANAEVFSKALDQKWSAKTTAPSATASPFKPTVSNADDFSRALQRLSSKPVEDGGASTKYTPAIPKPLDNPHNGMGGLRNDVAAPTMAEARAQANAPVPVKQAQLEAYDPNNTSTPKPSFWSKTKSVLASVFAPLSDTAKDNYRDLANTEASKKLNDGLNEVANSAPAKFLDKQSEKAMSAFGHGVENTLQGIGKVSSDVSEKIAPYKALTKIIPGASTLDNMLTAGQALGGFTQTNLDNKNLTQEFGAGFRRGMSGLRTTAGEVAKWQGLEQFGNDQINSANANKAGFDATPGHGFKGWESFFDPTYLASTMGENLPSTLALMPLGLAGGAIGGVAATATKFGPFGKMVMQSIGAGALSAPMEAAMESGQIYEDMRTSGHSVEESQHAAGKGFWRNTALLGVTNAAEFGSFFMPKGLNKVLGSLPGKLASGAVMEGGEEGAQQWIQNSSEGKPTSFRDPAMLESMGIGALMGVGFASMGGGHTAEEHPTIEKAKQTIQNIRDSVFSKLSDEDKNDMQIHIDDAIKQGMTEDQAFDQALDMVASHPDGAQLVQEATQEQIDNEHIRLQALTPALDSVENVTGDAALAEAPEKPAPTMEAPTVAPTDAGVQAHAEQAALDVKVQEFLDQQAQETQAPTAQAAPQAQKQEDIDFSNGAKVTLKGMGSSAFTITGSTATQVNLQSDKGGTLTVNKKAVIGNHAATPTPEALPEENTVHPETYQKAKDLVISTGKATVTHLQTNLKLNHADAMSVMDELEANGVVSPYNGAKPREVLHQPTESATPTEAPSTESPEVQYKKMREKLATSGNTTAQHKIKLIEEMHKFATDNGLPIHERYVELLDKFKKEIADKNQEKTDAEQRKAQQEKEHAEAKQKRDNLIQSMVDIAAKHPHVKSFLEDATIERGKNSLTLNGESLTPSQYDHTPETYLRKVFGDARKQAAKAEGREDYFQVGDKGTYNLGGNSSQVEITEILEHGDVRIKLPGGNIMVADGSRIEKVKEPTETPARFKVSSDIKQDDRVRVELKDGTVTEGKYFGIIANGKLIIYLGRDKDGDHDGVYDSADIASVTKIAELDDEATAKEEVKAKMTTQAKRSIEHFYHFWSESWTDEKIAERIASEQNLDVADVLAYALQYRADHGIPNPSKTEKMKAWNDEYRAEFKRKKLEELRAMSDDDVWTEYFKVERFSEKVQGTTKQEITAWFKSTAGIWGGRTFGDYGNAEHSGPKGWSLRLKDGRVLKKTHAQMADLYMEDQSRVAIPELKAKAFENLHFVTYDNADEMEVIRKAQPKAILISYARWSKKGKLAEFIKSLPKKPLVIVDNGAYSRKDIGMWDVMDFFTSELDETPEGAWSQIQQAQYQEEDGETDLREQFPAFMNFTDWLQSNAKAVDYLIPPDELDGTAEERQEKSLYAYRFFKAAGVNLIPVYAYGAPKSMIDELVSEGADYIAIGGTVKNPDLKKDIARAEYVKEIVQAYPDIKFHLLGTNDQWILDHIPGLYSADGSTWQRASMQGKTGENRIEAGVQEIKKREDAAYGDTPIASSQKAHSNYIPWGDVKKGDRINVYPWGTMTVTSIDEAFINAKGKDREQNYRKDGHEKITLMQTFKLPKGSMPTSELKNSEVTQLVVDWIIEHVPGLKEKLAGASKIEAIGIFKKEANGIGAEGDGVEFSVHHLLGPDDITKLNIHKDGGSILGFDITNYRDLLAKYYHKQENVTDVAPPDFDPNAIHFGDRVRVEFKDGTTIEGEYLSQQGTNIYMKMDEGQNGSFPADSAKTITKIPKPVRKNTRAQKIADQLKVLIQQGTEIKSSDLFRISDNVYKGTQSEGRYTPKDAYDAMELAVNQYLLEQTDIDFSTRDPQTVKANVQKLVELLDKLPTQSKRTEGQEVFQQFSTPPSIAYVASWVANITSNDVVLEPSAGIGGLALFGKAAGAEVIVNELDPRRLELIKQMPFDKFFMEDGEQINNILPKSIKPTVVVMNPPFSTSATRGVTDTKNSFNHVEQALKRLEPDGRLVAILGQGREGNSKSFDEWIRKLIKDGYSVRASVAMDGKNYMKYGTTFNVQIVVIDKAQGRTRVGSLKVNTLDQVIDAIGGIANDRKAAVSRNNGSEQNADQSIDSQRPSQDSSTGRNPSNSGSRNSSSSTSTVGNTGREHSNTVDEPRSDVQSTDDVREPAQTTQDDGRIDTGQPGNIDVQQDDVAGNTEGSSEESTGNVDQQENGSRDNSNKSRPVKKVKELTDSVFEDYEPRKLNLKNAKKHPGQLAESAAMAAIEMPDLNYKLKLPAHLIESGKLSSAQLEVIAYAGQAHMQMLRDGKTRKGLFVGDGTGLGKGREMVGIIMDNFAQGRTKAVWVSENKGLQPSATRDWTALDGDPKDLFGVPKLGETIAHKRGVLFTTYNTLSSGLNDTSGNAKQSRFAQMVAWLGKDFDGVIIFDEAHNMANAVDSQGARGMKKASKRALAGVELQKALPNARIVYASATGATEVSNLAYADRLGLWGTGTAFANQADFINKINAGGIAAMELVARDMKAMGLYIARNLSYNGVEYQKITHNLTADQTEIYDTLAHSWQIVLQNINAALEAIGVTKDGKSLDGRAKGNAVGQFWGAQQRFFNQILTAMQMPSVIAEAKKDLAAGKAVVMQLVNTNAASQERQVSKIEEEEGDLEDLDLTPREILLTFIDKSFPVQQFEQYMDDNGNLKSRPVFDSQGNPVINAEAQAMKDDLMGRLSDVRVPEGPLEMVLNIFGAKNVAEITGRNKRVVRELNTNTGNMEPKLETRTSHAVEADSTSFMNGDKNILIFSNAGGTGRSYHADRTAKNQKQRAHYLVQAGWEATKAVQGFGRTHRTNQASAPVYKLFTTNLKGQMRFVSSIARRLDQLGALTKGQRQTGSQGLFNSADNLESNIAKRALVQFYTELVAGNLQLNKEDVLGKMGLADKIMDSDKRLNREAPELLEVTKFLNRILTLESALQNDVFENFQALIVRMTEIALQDGTLDNGMENIKADTTKIVEETEIRRDEESNSVTKYVKLELGHKTIKVPLTDELDNKNFIGIFYNDRSKAVKIVTHAGTRTLENGSIERNFLLQGTERYDYKYMKESDFKKTKWRKLALKSEVQDEFDDLVNALQASGLSATEATDKAISELLPAEDTWAKALTKLPKYRTETLNMITGTLLPIWDRLPTDSVRVVRALTDDGEMVLGRIITENAINETLYKLGADKRAAEIDTTTLADKVLDDGYVVTLVNGWKFTRRKVSGEWRVEVIGSNLYKHSDEFRQAGVFMERIAYESRFFVPTGERGNAVIQEIIKNRPIESVMKHGDGPTQTNQKISEDFLAATSSTSSVSKPKATKKQPPANPVQRMIEETTMELTPKATEKIGDTLAHFLETIVYEGHVMRGSQGSYSEDSGIAAVVDKSYGEWRVVGHELGHAFSDYFGKGDERLSNDFDTRELRTMAHELYPDPDKLSNLPIKKQVEEGFAEFFRMWVVDPETAEKNAPTTFFQFNEYIDRNKKLSTLMRKIRNMVDRDFVGDAFARAQRGVISSDLSENKNYGEEEILGKWNKLAFNTVDSTLPAKKIMDHLEKNGGEVEVDLAKLMALQGNGINIAERTFTSQPVDSKGSFINRLNSEGEPIMNRTLQDIFQEGTDAIGEAINWETVKLKSIEQNHPLFTKYSKMDAESMFDTILLANRLKERYDRGYQKLAMTLEMVNEVLDIAAKKFPKVWDPKKPIGERGLAEEFADTFSFIVLEKAERAGLITKATRRIIEENSLLYIPIIEDKKAAKKISKKSSSGRTTKIPIGYFQEKETPILSAKHAVLIKLVEIEQAIEHKRAFDAFQDAIEVNQKDMGKFGRIIPAPKGVTILTPGEILERMTQNALDILEDHGDLRDVFKDTSLKFFRPAGLEKINPEHPIIMNIRNGKPVYMELNKDVYRMMKSMQPVMIEGIAKMLAYAARTTRHFALASTGYLPNAVFRDGGTALIQSQSSVHTMTDNLIRSVGVAIGWGENSEAILNSFINSGTFNSSGENMITSQLKNINSEGLIRTKAAGWYKVPLKGGKKLMALVLTAPVNVPHHILKFTEELPRISEYISVMHQEFEAFVKKQRAAQAANPNLTDRIKPAKELWSNYLSGGTDALPIELQDKMEGILVRAAYAASEVTTNFNRHGVNEFIRKYTPTVPFLLGTMQGMYRTARQVKDHPYKTAGITMAGFGLLAYLAWMAMNGDDDDKKVLQDMDSMARDKYIWLPAHLLFPNAKGFYIAIAKPFEYAIPMNMLERFLDHRGRLLKPEIQKDGRHATQDLGSLLSGITGVKLFSTVITTGLDMWGNHMSQGGDIIPQSEAKLAPYMQSGDDGSAVSLTSYTAAKLYADLAWNHGVKGFSPRMTDYFIKSNFGKFGSGLLTVSDFAVKYAQTGDWGKAWQATKPTVGLEYRPFIGQVIRTGAEGNSRIVEDFYDQYSQLQMYSATAGDLIKSIQDMAAKNPVAAANSTLVLPKVPEKMLQSESIQKLRYLPAMQYIAGEMNATRNAYAKAIVDAPNSDVRRTLTLQKDYVEKLTAGLLFGFVPAKPNADAGITQAKVDELVSYYLAGAQKKLIDEAETPKGVSEQVTYLTNMANVVK